MIRLITRLFIYLLLLYVPLLIAEVPPKKSHIILTDLGGGDPDDQQSLISYLFFANEFDTLGIVSTEPRGKTSKVRQILNAYEKDYRKFTPDYPTPQQLKRKVINGQTNKGVTRLARIIRKTKATRKNPLYITVWGNIHSLAEALEKLQPKHYAKIYCISVDGWNLSQGREPYEWLERNAKNMKWIRINRISRAMWVKGVDKKDTEFTNRDYVQFLTKNARNLGRLYNQVSAKVLSPGFKPSQTLYSMKEGDSPTFLYALWGNINPRKPSIVGKYQKWGGRNRHFREVQAEKYKWKGWTAGRTFDREEVMKRYKLRVKEIYNK